MRTIPAYVAAAVLAVSGATFIGCDRDKTATSSTTNTNPTDTRTTGEKVGDDLKTAANKTKDTAKRAGEEVTDAAETAGGKVKSTVEGFTGGNANRVPNLLANVTDAALTKDGLDDVVERFADADRNRIGKGDLNSGNDQLNALVENIRSAWKTKYGSDFSIKEEGKVFSPQFMAANTGEVVAKNSADTNVPGDTNRTTGAEAGRNVGTINIPESHGAAALTVPLIHEAGGWRIDAPDTLDAAKLRGNLIAHLNEVYGMKDQWSADVNDAYRAVAHHVLMAVMDQPAK